jgi:phthalate 4,5-cis-dihydrodiol dehydrogenase
VKSGRIGTLRAINAWNFNEFNHRPRLLEELKATRGPVLNQGPHHVDIVRQIGGGLVKSVRATTIPDGVTGYEGGYVCYLEFENRVPATLVYDGRSLFDTAELFGWIGEGGNLRDPKKQRAQSPLVPRAHGAAGG